MKAVTTFFLSLLLASTVHAAESRYAVDDPYVGVYEGTFKMRFSQGTARAQIRSLGKGSYDGLIAMMGTKDGVEVPAIVDVIYAFQPGDDGKGRFTAVHPNSREQNRSHPDSRFSYPPLSFKGEISPGGMMGEISGPWMRQSDSTFRLTRVKTPQSATLGAEPPKGAIVVFDGKDRGQWKDAKWKINNGALEVGGGNLIAEQSLTNFLLHVEFRTPNMPTELGQERGNSGVYLRSVFEVQVLDSFGLFPLADNDCGGIYKVKAPDWQALNACLPPGEWQTYDITFRDGDEKAGRLPDITVVQNGRTVIDHAKVPKDLVVNGTGGGEVGGGFLMLQDHGNAVQYRNIWALPID